jgi:purine nucleosidase
MAAMPTRTPLLLDVDTGIDDALALLYACASTEVELVGVTCIGGNVGARQVGDNTRAVLELAGRGDVPVFLGREQPLVKRLATAEVTHGPKGLGYAELPAAARQLEPIEAADGIIEIARSRRGEVRLVTLGPLTNLAVALEREPKLPRLLADWTLMGGAYRTSGNTTPTSEWNIHVDPHAAKAAFAGWAGGGPAGPDRPLPLALGLDVTEQVRILPGHLRHLAVLAGAQPLEAEELARGQVEAVGSVAANPILHFVVDALRFYFEFHERYDGFYGGVIHDPFAVAAAFDRSLVRAQAVYVDVEAGRNLAHGMTVADWRGLLDKSPNVDVAVEAEPDRFLERFIERVGGLAAATPLVAR